MIMGNGRLMLQGRRELSVKYQFSSDYDDRRAGFLYCNTAEIDPAVFAHRLELVCEDGSVIVLAVMNFSDKHVGVVGRLLSRPENQTAEPAQAPSTTEGFRNTGGKEDGTLA